MLEPVQIRLPGFSALYRYTTFGMASVVKSNQGEMWLVETKGLESSEVKFKDNAARLWCENATSLTGQQWRYIKVPQKEYERLQPVDFSDLLPFMV